MKVSFPAMRGVIGKRQYFNTMMGLSEIPHLFKFNDWKQFTPELRAQRVLVKSRVPEIVKYIIDNEDSYLFSSITDSFHSRGTKILCDLRTKKNVGEHHGQQGMNREFWE